MPQSSSVSLLEASVSAWHNFRTVLGICAIVFLVSRLYTRWTRESKQIAIEAQTDVISTSQKTRIHKERSSQLENLLVSDDSDEIRIAESPLLSDLRRQPKRVIGAKPAKERLSPARLSEHARPLARIQPLIFFSTLTGSTEAFAKRASELLGGKARSSQPRVLEPRVHDLSYTDFDDFFVSLPNSPVSEEPTRFFYLVLVPSYDIDTILNTFITNLQETHHDFRIDTAPLAKLAGFSVFGFGDKEGWPTEHDGFCYQAREVDKWLAKLTDRRRAYPLGTGDVRSDAKERLNEWTTGVADVVRQIAENGGLGEGVLGSGDAIESADEDEEAVDENGDAEQSRSRKARRAKGQSLKGSAMDDLEDMGRKALREADGSVEESAAQYPDPVDFTTVQASAADSVSRSSLKAMVPATSPIYASLTKQGYTIIGTHSGVKICRWTKSALRGRGSCYKHSFYGIASHQCMEATPSLSCSNKCVFCWRHGTNPVGTTWRWQTDPPDAILAGALEAHGRKIKALRGVPGVRAERFAEALAVRHCALSLVGEPIFYPHINRLLEMLHAKRISTFLVCNAQHPDQLAALRPPPTQLYVSVDASSKEALRRIDRPLHRDFWERFLRCMDVLRARRGTSRTVFRLTLVKGFNADEAEGYADLVARALPCFVEVKGVTYCGTSSSATAGLTMGNVPFHREVAAFAVELERALARRGLEYGIAAEHAHSCCILLGAASFRKEGKWHTLIDYERFFDLVATGEDFAPEEYMGEPTPEWAAFGKGGFDPADERMDRKGRPIEAKSP